MNCNFYILICGIIRGKPGGGGVFHPPPPEIPKALQNRAKLNPIVKTVKNCRIQDANTPRCSEKRQENSKTTAGSQLFYISNDE